MKAATLLPTALFALLSTGALGHDHGFGRRASDRHAAYVARQNSPAPTPTSSLIGGAPVPPLSSITSGMPVQPTVAVFTSFAPGASPPISGAPPLPTFTFVKANYPEWDAVPPTNSSEVQGWLKQIANAKIPNIRPTVDGLCDTDPDAAANAGPDKNCWWTCGGCLRDTDISFCPEKNTWGVSYDDGPSDYTPQLLNHLNDEKLKATFFVVGSRAAERPTTLQAEYMLGHEISVHTWSHTSLTTLTNEQIVAELGWTKKIIHDVIGVTPVTFRAPYGDLDDRVRAVAMAMGLRPIQWTSVGDQEFDTDDWRIFGGTATGPSSLAAFTSILGLVSSMSTGFIVLEHDLYQETVDMALGYFLPLAKQRSLTLKSIYECLGNPLGDVYLETSTNHSDPAIQSLSAAGGSVPPLPAGPTGASTSTGTGTTKPTGTGQSPSGKPTGTDSTSGSPQPTESPNSAPGVIVVSKATWLAALTSMGLVAFGGFLLA